MNAPRTAAIIIAAAAAHAAAGPTIQYIHSTAYVRADDSLIDGYAEDFFNGAGAFLLTAEQGTQYALAQGAPLSINILGDSAGPGGAYALDIASKFSVSEPALMTIDYDFRANSIEAGTFLLQDLTNDTTIVYVHYADNPYGTTTASLLPGVEYRVSANVYAIDGAGTAFVDAVIPSPGTLALLGAGALLACANRRRR